MRYFVTGASGFIGAAVVEDLIAHGHSVLGLARSDRSAATVSQLGATPIHGDLEDLSVLAKAAGESDGVLHLGFVHDFSNFARCCEVDRAAIQTMADALAGSGKPLVIAMGTLSVAGYSPATEDSPPDRNHPPFSDRVRSEDLILALAREKNIRGASVRLAPTVHGAGDQGLFPMVFDASRKAGKVVYIGDGSQRWPAVQRHDAATLWRLVAEKGRPGGAIYHGVAEEGVVMKDVMSLASAKLGLPLESVASVRDAAATLGFLAGTIAQDDWTSSAKTREELGWKPAEEGLLASLEAHYF